MLSKTDKLELDLFTKKDQHLLECSRITLLLCVQVQILFSIDFRVSLSDRDFGDSDFKAAGVVASH